MTNLISSFEKGHLCSTFRDRACRYLLFYTDSRGFVGYCRIKCINAIPWYCAFTGPFHHDCTDHFILSAVAQVGRRTKIGDASESQVGSYLFWILPNIKTGVNWYENRKHVRYGNDISFIFSRIMLHRTGHICNFWDVSQFYEQFYLFGTFTPLSPWSSDFVVKFFILEIIPKKTELQLQRGS